MLKKKYIPGIFLREIKANSTNASRVKSTNNVATIQGIKIVIHTPSVMSKALMNEAFFKANTAKQCNSSLYKASGISRISFYVRYSISGTPVPGVLEWRFHCTGIFINHFDSYYLNR